MAFDALADLGDKHPEYQSTILSVVDKIGSLIRLLWSKVGDFVHDVVFKITTWVKDVAQKVRSFFLDRLQDVTRIFGSFTVMSDVQILKGRQTLGRQTLGQQTLEESIEQLAKVLENHIKSGKEFTLSYASCQELERLIPEIAEDSTNSEPPTSDYGNFLKKISPQKLNIFLNRTLAGVGILSISFLAFSYLIMRYNYRVEANLSNKSFKFEPA